LIRTTERQDVLDSNNRTTRRPWFEQQNDKTSLIYIKMVVMLIGRYYSCYS